MTERPRTRTVAELRGVLWAKNGCVAVFQAAGFIGPDTYIQANDFITILQAKARTLVYGQL